MANVPYFIQQLQRQHIQYIKNLSISTKCKHKPKTLQIASHISFTVISVIIVFNNKIAMYNVEQCLKAFNDLFGCG